MTIWRILKQQHQAQFTASPSAVYRLVQAIRRAQPPDRHAAD